MKRPKTGKHIQVLLLVSTYFTIFYAQDINGEDNLFDFPADIQLS